MEKIFEVLYLWQGQNFLQSLSQEMDPSKPLLMLMCNDCLETKFKSMLSISDPAKVPLKKHVRRGKEMGLNFKHFFLNLFLFIIKKIFVYYRKFGQYYTY